MDAPRAVFVHGTGLAGAAAWPRQRDDARLRGSMYLTRPGYGGAEAPRATDWGMERDAVLAAVGSGAHLVAFSYGGLAALLAAAQHPDRIRTMCLIEPPAFSLARGEPGVEAHVAAVAPVLERRGELGPSEFVVALLRAFGQTDPVAPQTEEELRSAEISRLTAAPWEAPLSTDAVREVPTLVLTGGWNREYDEAAAALARAGATHRELPGAGHRVQDHPAFTEMILDLWQEHSAGHRG
ncbi:alpha/beta hydrolase [Microcella daejeonensis]|uniref:alpha/beta fold hydrolase n=1 Tax=Microcella daejeonensis TaxID=2994971 RepID=UPI00226FCF1C|nr:alpha/beta hydrolase [Microcella daejeonensis]WAB83312.1 alpha/beta hydrolase [Microcella daejeonensis]